MAPWQREGGAKSFVFSDGGKRVSVGHYGDCPTFGWPDAQVMGSYAAP